MNGRQGMHKLLILDEQEGVSALINEIINTEGYYSVSFAGSRSEAESLLKNQSFSLILFTADSKSCLDAADALRRKKGCPPFVIMGRELNDKGISKSYKRFKPIDEIRLPFEINDLFDRMEDDCFIAEGLVDELTGLFKKPCFDIKLERLMKKKTQGFFFCLSLNAYSFAANPSEPLQIQMAAYALKNNFKDGILGISGNQIVGFFPSQRSKWDFVKQFNKLIATMCQAADKPEIFIAAGAAESDKYGFSPEELLLYADKAMALSGEEGKNLIKFYK